MSDCHNLRKRAVRTCSDPAHQFRALVAHALVRAASTLVSQPGARVLSLPVVQTASRPAGVVMKTLLTPSCGAGPCPAAGSQPALFRETPRCRQSVFICVHLRPISSSSLTAMTLPRVLQ